MSTIINHDYRKRLDDQDRKAENRGTVICIASVSLMIGAYLALAPHKVANANMSEIEQLEAQNNPAECYGSQQYIDSSNMPEHLISPDMAAYITQYGKGGDLTECDTE